MDSSAKLFGSSCFQVRLCCVFGNTTTSLILCVIVVFIRTTFVKGKSTFWVKQESKPVSYVTETTKGSSKV